MKYIIIMLTIYSLNGYSLECPEGSSLIKETVTSRGSVRKEHCRKTPAVLSNAQKVDKLNELRKTRPDLSKQIDDKIKKLN